MKLSFAWIFDHIDSSYKDVAIDSFVNKFNQTTAEIESYRKLEIDLSAFTLVIIKSIIESTIESESTASNKVIAKSLELNQEIILPKRTNIKLDELYLVKYNEDIKKYEWATLKNLGSEKEELLSAVWCPKEDICGNWKKNIITHDYIIEIDNKSLTNRPDLWGHRGIAREVAALLNKKLKPEQEFLASYPIKNFDIDSMITDDHLAIAVDNVSACDRFAGLNISFIENKATHINLAFKLAKINSKLINTIVDATNYVMLDIGQPIHAFDRSTIKDHVTVRLAHDSEMVTLLDGETVMLTDQDIVVADGAAILALAGVMGGLASSITKNTNSIFVESAHFNPTVIRLTAARVKKRTDASARFEKNIDPYQNTHALLRFLAILENYSIKYNATNALFSLGVAAQPRIITLSHALIEKKIGMAIDPSDIIKVLTDIGFEVTEYRENKEKEYAITVPTFRGTKDITIKEDIIEEIGRLIGYSTIEYRVPTRLMNPFSIEKIQKLRALKQSLAFGANMHEAQGYAFFDESFLAKIKWQPHNALQIVSPVSENWQQLVTSLVPHLIKDIVTNYTKSSILRFFECARIWNYDKHITSDTISQEGIIENNLENNLENIIEENNLAGIMFDKQSVDFYTCKANLETLFNLLKITIAWIKPEDSSSLAAWYHPYQTAYLSYNNIVIGTAGKVNPQFLVQANLVGDAFIFEINLDVLLNTPSKETAFKPLSKYQEVSLDISIIVPLYITAYIIENAIKSADNRIKSVELIDTYYNTESSWVDKKSLTFNFILSDSHKTLTKEEIDQIFSSVEDKLRDYVEEIR